MGLPSLQCSDTHIASATFKLQSIGNVTPLEGWNNFYVIVGSSAGALIGLQFVVLTLISNMTLEPDVAQAGTAFTTPSVVHFGVVLLLSAILTAPWQGIGAVSILWGLVGVVGLAYAGIVARRMQRQSVYEPVFEDWLFHCLLPVVSYGMLAVTAVVARSHARPALFGVAATALILLFIGIHNAWDTVTYHVFVRKPRESETRQDEREGEAPE